MHVFGSSDVLNQLESVPRNGAALKLWVGVGNQNKGLHKDNDKSILET